VLEHVTPLDEVIKEINRTGKNFIITVPNEKLLTQEIINKLIGYNPATIGHVTKHNNAEWSQILGEHLTIEKIRGIFLFNLLNMPSLRMLHNFFYYIEKKINLPRFSFYLIYIGRCNRKKV
jgi:hypothetical protein